MEREEQQLQQQVAERSEQMGRIKDVLASNESRYFQDWKSKADDTWERRLSEYQKKAMDVAQEKTEGLGLVIGAPEIYRLGELGTKVARRYAPEKMAAVDKFTQDLATRFREGAEETSARIAETAENVVQSARGTISAGMENLGARLAQARTERNVVAEFGERGFVNPNEELLGGHDLNEFGQAENPFSSGRTRVINAMRDVEQRSEERTAENVSGGVETAAEETAPLVGEEEGIATAAEAAPEAIPVLAVAGALAAIGTGLFDIFEPHHDDEPKTPTPPKPLQNRYSIQSTIIPATQASLSSQGTMTF